MTKIYTAGEHARVIKTDTGYSETLGDQTGMVGTVVRGGTSPYLTFPHTGDAEYYYFAEEVAPVGTPAPEPEKEYLFREGDTVRYTDTNTAWKGTEFTVSHDVEKPDYGNVSIRLLITKATEALKRSGYYDGRTVSLSSNSVEKFTPKPEVPVFNVGDRVEFIEDYNGNQFIGDAGTVTYVEKGEPDRHLLIEVDMDKGGKSSAFAYRLKLSDKPAPAKFKVGDWVKVEGYDSNIWEGTVGKVKLINGSSIVINNDKDGSLGFDAKFLVPTEEPYVPKFKVGDWVQVKDWSKDWDSVVSKVLEVPAEKGGYYKIQTSAESGWLEKGHKGGFSERYLTPAEEPKPEPKFKEGDWVEVHGRNDSYDGRKATITSGPDYDGFYSTLLEGKTYAHFRESQLKASEKPADPHWTVTKPVGSLAQVELGGKPDRVVLKVSDTEWLHLYQNDQNGAVGCGTKRSVEQTERLLHNRIVKWKTNV